MEKTKVVLKNYVVLKDHEGNYIHWSTAYYEDYVMKAIRKGGTPAYTVVAHFNGDEDLIKELSRTPQPSDATGEVEDWKGKCIELVEKLEAAETCIAYLIVGISQKER